MKDGSLRFLDVPGVVFCCCMLAKTKLFHDSRTGILALQCQPVCFSKVREQRNVCWSVDVRFDHLVGDEWTLLHKLKQAVPMQCLRNNPIS